MNHFLSQLYENGPVILVVALGLCFCFMLYQYFKVFSGHENSVAEFARKVRIAMEKKDQSQLKE